MSAAVSAVPVKATPAEARRSAIIRTTLAVVFAAYVWMLFYGVHYHVLELRIGEGPKQSVVRLVSLQSPFTIRVPDKPEARRRLGFVYRNNESRHTTTEAKLPIEPTFQAGWGVMYSKQVVETTAPEAEAEFVCSHHTFRLKGKELRTEPTTGPITWQLKEGETVEINVRRLPKELPDPDNKNFKEEKQPFSTATEPADGKPAGKGEEKGHGGH